MKLKAWLLPAFILAMWVQPVCVASESATITVLYDAFGKSSSLQKDWGFSAYIEYAGKHILFDTGNNADIFAHNVRAKGIDLTKLDFVIVSHRHGDHTSGLNYLMKINPGVKIYAPKENFGVFGAALPGTFYKQDETLPKEMRYFDGAPPATLQFGSAWPEANFTWVSKDMEVSPGFHLILLKGSWGVDLDVMEISLAIDTPDGTVLVVGCSHPTLEKIVATTISTTHKPIHLVFGGTHLLPAKPEQIEEIANILQDRYHVSWLAPVHCTGEPAFAILSKRYAEHYLYAGLGTTLHVASMITATDEHDQPQLHAQLDDEELQVYRALMLNGDDYQDMMLANSTRPR